MVSSRELSFPQTPLLSKYHYVVLPNDVLINSDKNGCKHISFRKSHLIKYLVTFPIVTSRIRHLPLERISVEVVA